MGTCFSFFHFIYFNDIPNTNKIKIDMREGNFFLVGRHCMNYLTLFFKSLFLEISLYTKEEFYLSTENDIIIIVIVIIVIIMFRWHIQFCRTKFNSDVVDKCIISDTKVWRYNQLLVYISFQFWKLKHFPKK